MTDINVPPTGGSDGGKPVEPLVISDESTVIAEFKPEDRIRTGYQSEAALEADFIRRLEEQAYEYLPIKGEADLITNLRNQLERLNSFTFTDKEWQRFYSGSVTKPNDTVIDKTRRIQRDHVQVLVRDDGTTKNVRLIDKSNIHNNRLQVINQYETTGATSGGFVRDHRYDVTILVNGLPLVHVELKRRGVPISEAFNQIERYRRESFWSGTGLFDYVQIFVISNGTHTKYYANTVRLRHIREAERSNSQRRGKVTSNSFKFTSWWADARNRRIAGIEGFTRSFLAPRTVLAVLTRYCVLDTSNELLVLRPYQIVAAERIVQRVDVAGNYPEQLGTLKAGGYIWHTTGSGKTLTSFKTAQLIAEMPHIDKVLFVVDRKDLDAQTIREYERFSPGAANGSRNTTALGKQLTLPVGAVLLRRAGDAPITNQKIAVTTIQKLDRFVAGNSKHEVYGKRVVLIFDECHRTQFGDMQQRIRRAFRKGHIFGFTGTPIFADNAARASGRLPQTTEQTFGDRLHTYTIVDAIKDETVLPFRTAYHRTIRAKETGKDAEVEGIDTEEALLAPERVALVVSYILENFKRLTGRDERLTPAGRRAAGFNAMLATASIEAAKRYYAEFKVQQAGQPSPARLRVATIFSYSPNEELPDGILDDDEFDTDELDQPSRDFLEGAIQDYNQIFGTSFNTSADGFQAYYDDVTARLKNRDLDLVIVVNMMLTGFDATTLNTLFVDKNLRQHGLLQAYSRTNRILDSTKHHGNIVTFRDLDKATEEALSLFGDKDASSVVLIEPYSKYFDDYAKAVGELTQLFPVGDEIVGEQRQVDFVSLFGLILRLRSVLSSFDEFEGNDPLSEADEQDYRSEYVDLYELRRKREKDSKVSILEDVVFEMELIKRVEANVDYVVMLVEERRSAESEGDTSAAEILRRKLNATLDSSPSLYPKRELIAGWLAEDAHRDLSEFVAERRAVELDQIITDLHLDAEKTRHLMDLAFRDGEVPTAGPAIAAVLPPVSRFSAAGADHAAQRSAAVERLTAYFDRFYGLV